MIDIAPIKMAVPAQPVDPHHRPSGRYYAPDDNGHVLVHAHEIELLLAHGYTHIIEDADATLDAASGDAPRATKAARTAAAE